MIFTGLELIGEIPFTDVIIHSTVLAPDGRRMSKSLGTGIDPRDADRDARRRCAALRAPEDVLHAGRALLRHAVEEGRKLANKLWNVSRLLLQERGDVAAGRAAELGRGALDPRASRATRAELEDAFARFAFAADGRRPLPPHVRRLLRLVRGGDQAAAGGTGGAGHGARRAREAPAAPAPGDAARDRGDLVAVPPDDRLIVAPWPEPTDAYAADLHALDAVQEAAAIFRRSGVAVPLEGDEQRIFAAVVRPERSKVNGNATAEIERLRKEIERGERVLANDKFVANAKPEVVEAEREKLARYRRELDALSGWSAAWLDSQTPWPKKFGLGRMRTLLAALGDPQLAYPAIHVVGTNGKSTATLTIEALLRAEGLSVGSTISPHIRWLGRADPRRRRACRLRGRGRRVRPDAEAQEATQFETVCAAAFAEFAARGVDVAVVEAGLGGRLDATNVLRSHVVLLTSVGLEHTDVLGDTREQIAAEKLAVVQEGTVAVLPDEEFAHLAGPNVVVGGAREAAEAFLGRRGRARRRDLAARKARAAWGGGVGRGAQPRRRRVARPATGACGLRAVRLGAARQGCARDARRARRARPHARRDPVVEPTRAAGRGARTPRRAALRHGRDRARSRHGARPRTRTWAGARDRVPLSDRRSLKERAVT